MTNKNIKNKNDDYLPVTSYGVTLTTCTVMYDLNSPLDLAWIKLQKTNQIKTLSISGKIFMHLKVDHKGNYDENRSFFTLLWQSQEINLIIQKFQHLISNLFDNMDNTKRHFGTMKNTKQYGRTFLATDPTDVLKVQHLAKHYLHKCFSACMARADDKSLFL